MDEDIEKYSIGVFVGRLHINELHEGHHHVIKQVVDNHKKTIIFLGVPKFVGTRRNPLDFDTRKKMVQTHYPDSLILAIPDQSDNTRWASELDKRIREVYQHGEVLMYGSRDSFIPHYKEGGGKFKTKELKPFGTFAGTDIRRTISDDVKNSKDFRSGVIYHAYNSYPRVIPTVDIFVHNENRTEVLLAKKYDETLWRFIGGFVRVEDSSLEHSAKRIVNKEAGVNVVTGDYKFLLSKQVSDWRFRGEDDKLLTSVFTCQYQWGNISASDDIMELKWFKISDIKDNILMEEHRPIFTEIKKHF
jgi:bifunctional NMN adenylyltransferase/nudix hydrolase